MKILHVSLSDKGGAANAAIRIHKSLLKIGVDSSILFLNTSKKTEKSYVFNLEWKSEFPEVPSLTLKNYIQEKIYKTYQKQQIAIKQQKLVRDEFNKLLQEDSLVNFELFSEPYSSFEITSHFAYLNTDIIHLHFVSGFIDFPSFFSPSNKPVIWSLHDEYAYLGAFHFEEDSVFNSLRYGDIDTEYRELKLKMLRQYKKLGFIIASDWIYNKITRLHLTEDKYIFRINYPLDVSLYKIYDKKFAHDFLRISEIAAYETKIVLLFSASNLKNKRKGFDLIYPLLTSELLNDFIVLIMGEVEDRVIHPHIIYLGTVSDERLMPIIYTAADFLLISSRAENFSYSKIEALCCGTPILAFPVGDQEKFLLENEFGIIMKDFSIESIEESLFIAKENKHLFNRKNIALKSSKLFSDILIAKQVKNAYLQIL